MTYEVQSEAFAVLSWVIVIVYNLTEFSGEKFSAGRKFYILFQFDRNKGRIEWDVTFVLGISWFIQLWSSVDVSSLCWDFIK